MKYRGLDIETADWGEPYVVTGYDHETDTRYFWQADEIDIVERVCRWSPTVIAEMQRFIDGAIVIGHNILMFDQPILEELGLDFSVCVEVIDTQICSHVCNALQKHGLKSLCRQFLGISEQDERDLIAKANEARRIIESCKRCFEKSPPRIMPSLRAKGFDDWAWINYLSKAELPEGKGKAKRSMYLVPVVFPGETLTETYAGMDAERPVKLFLGQHTEPQCVGFKRIMDVKKWWSA